MWYQKFYSQQPIIPRSQLLILAAAVSALSSGVVFADPAQARIQELEQRLLILERNLELRHESQDNKEKAAPVVNAGAGGFSITNAKKDYELRFSAVGQFDSRVFLDGATASGAKLDDGFVTRRLRPTLSGRAGLLGFRFTPEFGGGGVGSSASIVDAFADLNFSPAAVVRVGKQKSAVSIDRLRSGAALPFVERGLANELAPNRDLGVSLNGRLLNEKVDYTVGVFNGVADGRDVSARDDAGKEAQARVFVQPFRGADHAFSQLGVGVAGTYGSKKTSAGNTANANNTLPRYRSSGQEEFFAYQSGTTAAGTHKRLFPQLSFFHDNFGLVAEYGLSEQKLSRGGVQKSVRNRAYDVTATYTLTGEAASFSGVRPNAPFALGGDGWGALELAARVGGLKIGDEAFEGAAADVLANVNAAAREARNYGVGLNWYLTRNVKLATDFNVTSFDGGAAGGADRKTERALFSRVQFTY